MTDLDLGPVERSGLQTYLRRVVALDDRAAVRLQARGTVAGVWAGPPFGVLALRPVALLSATEVDVTVSAQRLVSALEQAGHAGEPAALPASVVGAPWAALLPPRDGWSLEAEVPVAMVVDQVAVAVEGFRRRVDALAADGRTPTALEAVAEELWSAPSVGPVPLRAAHAASRLGLLGRAGVVTASRAGQWLRLGCPGGSILLAEGGPGSAPGALGLGGIDVLGAFTPTPPPP